MFRTIHTLAEDRFSMPVPLYAQDGRIRLSQTFSFLLLPGKILPLEKNQINGPAGHATVGKIEDRREESERIPAYKRHPFREGGIYDRKIEHIHDLSEKERSITSGGRQEFSHGPICGLTAATVRYVDSLKSSP